MEREKHYMGRERQYQASILHGRRGSLYLRSRYPCFLSETNKGGQGYKSCAYCMYAKTIDYLEFDGKTPNALAILYTFS